MVCSCTLYATFAYGAVDFYLPNLTPYSMTLSFLGRNHDTWSMEFMYVFFVAYLQTAGGRI